MPGIQIEYETFGNLSGRPLLRIMGLGGQLIFWDEDLCKDLAERGYYVVRFDNRLIPPSIPFISIDHPGLHLDPLPAFLFFA